MFSGRNQATTAFPSCQTKSSGLSAESETLFRSSMIELGVLGGLILVMVVSIYLLRRAHAATAAA